jgi:hypothetical protein
MTSKTILTALALCTGLVTVAIAAPPPSGSDQTVTPSARGPLTPLSKDVQDKLRPVCRTDLTISRLVLTRSGPTRNIISVAVEVTNLGPNNFVSDPRQAGVSAILTNGNTNGVTNLNLGSISTVRAGATRVFGASTTSMPFDTFEFGGEVSASISYDPDIGADGQPCNDDAVATNNTFALSNDTVRAWLGTTNNRLDVRR